MSAVRALEAAVSAPSVQLEHERNRAARAEQRIDELQTALVEERRRLLAVLTDDRQKPWWRRWWR